jgi:hypothetical protein
LGPRTLPGLCPRRFYAQKLTPAEVRPPSCQNRSISVKNSEFEPTRHFHHFSLDAKAAAEEAAARKAPNLADFPPSRIRNFCIISHIDHGKTTMSTRIMEKAGTVDRPVPCSALFWSPQRDRGRVLLTMSLARVCVCV